MEKLTPTSRWKEAALLVVGSLVVGRFCWTNLNIWGGNQSDWSGIAPFGLVAAAGGIVYGFLMLAGVAVSTLISGGAVAAPHPLPDVKPQTDAQPVVANATVEEQKWLWALWVALLEIVAFNLYCQFFTQLGRHGRLWLGLIDQIAFIVALSRNRKALDPPGLALALAASVQQIVFVFMVNHFDPAEAFWGNVAFLLNLAASGFIIWMWVRSPRLRPDLGFLISIFPALFAHTWASHLLFQFAQH